MSVIDAALLAGRPPRAYLNPVPVILRSTKTNNTANYADVTGLEVNLAAGVTYIIEAYLRFQSSATNCAPAFDFNGPATTFYNAMWSIPTTDTAAPTARHSRSYDFNTSTSGVGIANSDYLAHARALIQPSAAGVLAVRFRRGVNAGTISVFVGSHIVAIPLE